LFQTKNKQDQY